MTLEKYKEHLKKKIKEYCSENMVLEPETGALVFGTFEQASFYEGMQEALDLAEAGNE